MKRVSKEQYIEYLKEFPCSSLKNIAEHFGIKKSLVSCHFRQYDIHLRDIRPDNYHGIPAQEIVDFAAEHTMKEIIAHYNIPGILSFINRRRIPFLKKIKPYGECHRDMRRARKDNGELYEMMYVLSRYYSLSSIAKAFGVSREWVRIVCDDYDSGKRIVTVDLGGEKSE